MFSVVYYLAFTMLTKCLLLSVGIATELGTNNLLELKILSACSFLMGPRRTSLLYLLEVLRLASSPGGRKVDFT